MLAQEKMKKVVLISEPNLHIQACSQGICLCATTFFPHPTKHFFCTQAHFICDFNLPLKKAYVRWAAKLQDCKFKCQNVNEKCTDMQEACHWNYTELLRKNPNPVPLPL